LDKWFEHWGRGKYTEYGVPEYGVRSTEYGVTEYGVRSTEYRVRSTEYGVTELRSTEYGVTEYGVQSTEFRSYGIRSICNIRNIYNTVTKCHTNAAQLCWCILP
jgi:hypothetical protein